MEMIRQDEIDEQNIEFWDELCGTQLANSLGVNDSSPSSLKKFDDWYMNFYSYLHKHIPFIDLNGKKVLEVGLGYGTVAQKIAESGANYSGLDIARNPVQMVNHRLHQSNLEGYAQQGSILACPFPDQTFDFVISIGCFHHTGNLQQALDEAWRVLKPGGHAMIMVYYAYSYRCWQYYTKQTFLYFLWDKLRFGKEPYACNHQARAHYDQSQNGLIAPETVFTSRSHIKRMTQYWSSFKGFTENIGQESLFKNIQREKLCHTLGPMIGLDLYCHLKK